LGVWKGRDLKGGGENREKSYTLFESVFVEN